MNKKGQADIMIFLMIFVVIIGVCMLILHAVESSGGQDCKTLCRTYNYEFVSYETGVYRSDECWCRTHDNKPERVS